MLKIAIRCLSSALLIAVLLISLGANLAYTTRWVVGQMRNIVPRWNATVEEKWEFTLGSYYDYIRFVKLQTPPSARILIPSSRSLPLNLWMHNYFWYPRLVFQGNQAHLIGENAVDYVMVFGPHPMFPVAGERIMLDAERGLVKVKKGSGE